MLLSTREIWSSWGGSSRELWRWLYWVWASWSSFSLCSLPWAELCIDNWKGVDNPSVWATAEQCWHIIRLFLQLSFPSTKELGVRKMLGGNTTRPADQSCLKGYSLSYDITWYMEDKERRMEEQAFIMHNICLLEKLLHALKPWFLESTQTWLANGKFYKKR